MHYVLMRTHTCVSRIYIYIYMHAFLISFSSAPSSVSSANLEQASLPGAANHCFASIPASEEAMSSNHCFASIPAWSRCRSNVIQPRFCQYSGPRAELLAHAMAETRGYGWR